MLKKFLTVLVLCFILESVFPAHAYAFDISLELCELNPISNQILTTQQQSVFKIKRKDIGQDLTWAFRIYKTERVGSQNKVSKISEEILSVKRNEGFERTIGPFEQGQYFVSVESVDAKSSPCSLPFTVVGVAGEPVVTTDNLVIELASSQPINDKAQLEASYVGQTQGECLVWYLQKDTQYIKPIDPGLAQTCYQDQNSYTSHQVSTTSVQKANFGIQKKGDYLLQSKHYRKDCLVADISCKWEFVGASNILKFSIIEAPSNYKLHLVVDPPVGDQSTTFTAEGILTRIDGTPIADVSVRLIASFGTDLGAIKTDADGKFTSDITQGVLQLNKKGDYEVEARAQLPDETVTAKASFKLAEDVNLKAKEFKKCDPNDKSNPCASSAGLSCRTSDGKYIDPKGNVRDDKGGIVATGQEGDGILTVIGCVPIEPAGLIKSFTKLATGAGGGIALLMMIFGAFRMITSAGNPETIKKGQEQFASAVIGLLFIIFSVLLLEIIGVDILNLPGFGR